MNPAHFIGKGLSLIVLFSYCLGVGSVFLPLIEYALDYQRIATEECENIEVPELECNGKCYLAKQITKQTVPEAAKPGAKSFQLKLGVDPHFTASLPYPTQFCESEVFTPDLTTYQTIILERVDHPPEC